MNDAAPDIRPTVNFRPLGDRVLVRPEKKEETMTPSGIVIPEQAQQDSQIGEVLAVGPGRVTDEGVRIEMAFSVGDIVFYGRYAGSEVDLGDEVLLVLREADIMGVAE